MPSAGKNRKPPRVLFVVPAPTGISPGQRFRFEHYLGDLEKTGIRYRISSFYTLSGWRKLFRHGGALGKALTVVRGFGRRFLDMFRLWHYDFVYVYREAAPIGPPFFEWVIARLCRKKMIYDFDDAIWIPASSQYNKLASGLRWFSKVGTICRWSHIVTVGNAFLADFARQHNPAGTRIIPTVVNTEAVHKGFRQHEDTNLVVGWTGTFSTLKYLDMVLPALQNLQEKLDFTFLVIADKDPALPLKKYRYLPWRKDTEVDDLLNMDIGLMPLYDDELSKGKCGFKAIQYMSLGIPAVVSPVGVNAVIVENGLNGYVCGSPAEWEAGITLLLTNRDLRTRMGQAAQSRIEAAYSVNATRSDFVNLFV